MTVAQAAFLQTYQRVSAEGHICQNAEYITVSAQNVWPVPNEIPDKFVALFDPLGNAMHTVMAQPIACIDYRRRSDRLVCCADRQGQWGPRPGTCA